MTAGTQQDHDYLQRRPESEPSSPERDDRVQNLALTSGKIQKRQIYNIINLDIIFKLLNSKIIYEKVIKL